MARRLALALTLAIVASTGAITAPALAYGPTPTIVVGDSLAVGTKPYLGGLLSGWPLAWDAVSGRTTPQGMRALRGELRHVQPGAVVISLGSNDGPSGLRFSDRIRRIRKAIPANACIIWPTIVRPPRKGDETQLNRSLRAAAKLDDRFVLVDWIGAVGSGRVVLPDGLHPDPAGYQERSRMISAALAAGCPAAGTGTAQLQQGGAVAPVS